MSHCNELEPTIYLVLELGLYSANDNKGHSPGVRLAIVQEK